MNNIKTNTVLKISCSEEMEHLVNILTCNGYKVNVVAAYETKEDVEARFNNRVPSYYKPRINHWDVEIGDRIDVPEFDN